MTEQQQLVARIKRGSKYWGQTPPNKWFDVCVVGDTYYQLRGNNNDYRVKDVVLGMRIDGDVVVDLASGKTSIRRKPRTMFSSQGACPTCDGKGETYIDEDGRGLQDVTIAAAKQGGYKKGVCPECRGTGRWPGFQRR